MEYGPRYIRNRPTLITVTPAGGSAIPLVNNQYDAYRTATYYPTSQTWPLQASGAPVHDGSYDVNFLYRGNVTMAQGWSGTQYMGYQDTGVVYQTQDGAGHTMNATPSSSTGYSLPGVLTPGDNGGNSNLATSLSYTSSWQVTGVTGPNGANSNTFYDQYGRPLSTVSPDGASTGFTYTYNPNTQTATVNNKWKRTTLDGFGRTVKEEMGNGPTTNAPVSVVDTQYAPCACSPLGKLYRVSRRMRRAGRRCGRPTRTMRRAERSR